MKFDWTDGQIAFRDRVRSFLRDHLPADWERVAHGPGSVEQTRFSRNFCRQLAEAGLLTPHWPRAWGGQELDPWCQQILAEEMWSAGEPRGPQYMNVNWIGPTLMRFGSDAQQRRYLPPIAGGDAIWCQGFSEPGAGSDLAALRTRATLSDGVYRVDGQKIWTSYAAEAETCFLLARTGPDRKTGISIFLVPMETKGITVRAIPSLVGEGDIHEVFFDDVAVPPEARLGEEGQAWTIIAHALRNERLGIPRYALARKSLDRAVGTLAARAAFDSSARLRAVQAAAACEAARLYAYRCVDLRVSGLDPGAETSAARLATIAAERAVTEFVVEFLPEALANGDPLLLTHHQRAIVAGIASGAAEIQLNIVASDLLGLPREPR
jgi:alkylation response protein AidB-like acyl-CoA dehydrogenase